MKTYDVNYGQGITYPTQLSDRDAEARGLKAVRPANKAVTPENKATDTDQDDPPAAARTGRPGHKPRGEGK